MIITVVILFINNYNNNYYFAYRLYLFSKFY